MEKGKEIPMYFIFSKQGEYRGDPVSQTEERHKFWTSYSRSCYYSSEDDGGTRKGKGADDAFLYYYCGKKCSYPWYKECRQKCSFLSRCENEKQSDQKSHKTRSKVPSSNARIKLQCKWHQVFLLIAIVTLSLFCQVSEECPVACECKWKSGKESVICSHGKTKLTSIPVDLEPGTQLLDLSKNNFQLLQSKVFHKLNLLNLQKIYLMECGISSLEKNVFFKLSNLVELDLSGNKIDSVPTHTFDQIPELRELKINANPITRLLSNAFSILSRLVRLELSRCRIGLVDTSAFRGLVSLEWLKLDGNRLLSLNVVSLYPLRNLHGLQVQSNPWNCSCTLQPLIDWMLKNNVPFGIPPVCAEPSRLAGKSWDQLHREDFACLPKVQSSVLAEVGELIKVAEGENATLLCRLQATADTQVRWMHGNRAVVVSTVGNVRYSLFESFKLGSGDSEKGASVPSNSINLPSGKQTLGTKTSRLTVIRAKLRDSGLYLCRAETRAGSVSANFTVQVLKLNAEHLSGRTLLYGATLAAVSTLTVCVTLLFLVFFCTRRKPRTGLEEKIELNHVSQNGRLPHNGHGNNSSHRQNGGTAIPLLQNHNHVNSNSDNVTPRHYPNVKGSCGILSNLTLPRKPPPPQTISNASNRSSKPGRGKKHYRALATKEMMVDEETDNDSSSGDERCKLKPDFSPPPPRNSKVLFVNLKEKVPVQMQTASKGVIKEIRPDVIENDGALSPFKDSGFASNTHDVSPIHPKTSPNASTSHALTTVSPATPSYSTREHHRRSSSLGDSDSCQPLLAASLEKNPCYNQPFPSTSVQSVDSTSCSNSNSNSKSDISFGSTTTHQTLLSTPVTTKKFTFTQRPTPPPPPSRAKNKRHSPLHTPPPPNPILSRQNMNRNPNQMYFYKQTLQQQAHPHPLPHPHYAAGGRRYHHQYQRRSMPTSPIHHTASHPHQQNYPPFYANNPPSLLYNQGSDPGLAQAQHHHQPYHPHHQQQDQDFVSSSQPHQEYDYHAAQLAAFLEEYRQLQMELMRMSASLTEMDPVPTSTSTTTSSSNINDTKVIQSSTTSRNVLNVNSIVREAQLSNNDMLKNSGTNNNYLV